MVGTLGTSQAIQLHVDDEDDDGMEDGVLTEIKVFPARRLVRGGVRVWGVGAWMGRV